VYNLVVNFKFGVIYMKKILKTFAILIFSVMILTSCTIATDKYDNSVETKEDNNQTKKIQNNKENKKDERVLAAIEKGKEYCKEAYDDGELLERKAEIVDVRILDFKDNISDKVVGYDMIKDIDYVVEFIVRYNYYGYKYDGGTICTNPLNVINMVVSKDGEYEMYRRSWLDLYRSFTYNSDLSQIIESVDEFGSEYNGIYTF